MEGVDSYDETVGVGKLVCLDAMLSWAALECWAPPPQVLAIFLKRVQNSKPRREPGTGGTDNFKATIRRLTIKFFALSLPFAWSW